MSVAEQGSHSQSRLRRLAQFPLFRILIALAFIGAAYLVGGLGLGWLLLRALKAVSMDQSVFGSTLYTAMVLLLVHMAYVNYVHLIEKRQVAELAPNRCVTDTAKGVLLGVVIGGLVFGFLWILRCLEIVGTGTWRVLLPALLAAVTAGYWEELVFRGIVFRIVEESLGTWLTLALSAVIFGLLHLKNPNASITGALAIAFTGGIVLGAAYVLARSLWVPIGAHVAWNFIQGGVFGAPVSGKVVTGGLLLTHLSGNPLLSGGSFGPEASVIAVVVGVVLGAWLCMNARNQGRVMVPIWRRVETVKVSLPVAS
jgi:uncharacterized protein